MWGMRSFLFKVNFLESASHWSSPSTDLSPSSCKDSLIERGLPRTVLFPSGPRPILLCLLSSSQMPVYKSLPPASTSSVLLRCGIRRQLGSTVLPFGNCSDEGYKYLLKCRSRWISFHHYLFLKRSLLSPGHLLTLMATVTRISVEMQYWFPGRSEVLWQSTSLVQKHSI